MTIILSTCEVLVFRTDLIGAVLIMHFRPLLSAGDPFAVCLMLFRGKGFRVRARPVAKLHHGYHDSGVQGKRPRPAAPP
jgi:hypothetical protein